MGGSWGVNEENISSILEFLFFFVYDVDEDLEVFCVWIEVLYVYGYYIIVGKLVMKFVEKILSDGCNLNILFFFVGVRNSNRGLGLILFISIILIKVVFFCNVFVEDLYCYYLVFRVGMLGLEMLR